MKWYAWSSFVLFLFVVDQARCNSAHLWAERLVPAEDKKEFALYYKDMVAGCAKQRVERRKRFVRDVVQQGKAALHVRRDPSSQQLLSEISRWAQVDQQKLYLRFGSYERFLKDRAARKLSAWNKIRYYAQSARRSLTDIFNRYLPSSRVVS